MGLEKVIYKDKYIYEHPVILCRIQKFLWLTMSSTDHPVWFTEMLNDINHNSQVPVPKVFFDDEEVEFDPQRKEYVIDMLDKAITRKIKESTFYFR